MNKCCHNHDIIHGVSSGTVECIASEERIECISIIDQLKNKKNGFVNIVKIPTELSRAL